MEDLRHYIKRAMEKKRLSPQEVSRRSDNTITSGYVVSLLNGKAKNPSVEKLKALAAGLGVEVEELFQAACGLPTENARGHSLEAVKVVELVQQVAMNPVVAEIMQEMLSMTPEDRAILLEAARGFDFKAK